MQKRWFVLALLAVMLITGSISAGADSSSPDAVLAWNTIVQRTAIQVWGLSPAHSFVAIAYAQAAAAATHDVLVHYFPLQQGALDTDYTAALAAIPDGPAKDAGIQVGQEAAAGIIALRQDDGLGADVGFVMPPPAPGVWQLPADQSPLTPWLAEMRPFMLERPDQFRPGPPLELTSREWAGDYNEVKAVGRDNTPYRSPEQTDVALFWSTNPPVQYNNAFQYLVRERGLDAAQAARLLAMGDLGLPMR